MSILIAARENDRTIVGSDGLITESGYISSHNTKKWYIINNRAVGSAGMMNMINYTHECTYDVLESPTKLITYIRNCLEDNKWVCDTTHHTPYYGSFEVGLVCESGLYVIDAYLSYLKQDTIILGCNEVGSVMMYVNKKMSLKKRIIKAIETCAYHNVFCGGEIYIDEL